MAGRGSSIVFNVRIASVLDGLRIRSQAARDLANAATISLAEQIIPAAVAAGALPASEKIRNSLVPSAYARSGGLLLGLRVTQGNPPYYKWYTAGTVDHYIFPRQEGGVLAFYWAKIGQDVVFSWVHHPGAKPHPETAAAFNAFAREMAREAWTIALRSAMHL